MVYFGFYNFSKLLQLTRVLLSGLDNKMSVVSPLSPNPGARNSILGVPGKSHGGLNTWIITPRDAEKARQGNSNTTQLVRNSHFQRKIGCLGWDSNPWPSAFQAMLLPTKLPRQLLQMLYMYTCHIRWDLYYSGTLPSEEGGALGTLVQAAATSFFTHGYASEEDKESKVLYMMRLNNLFF